MNLLALATLSLGLTAGAVALVQGDQAKPRFTHPLSKDADGGMARYIACCKPSLAHERLQELLGSYETTTRMTMMPGQPPLETKGTMEVSWFTEGKWLQAKWSGEMFGRKVNGTWMLGYDNFKERYVYVSIDSLQTTVTNASGHFDQSGDNLILWGTIDEPATPEQDKYVKYVFRGFGQDKCTFEVHDMMIGETNTKVIEIEQRRKK